MTGDDGGEREDSGENSVDSEDPNADEQYHLAVGPGDMADAVLLPGDPGRVGTITDLWDDHEVVGDHREYTTATGSYEGTPLSVTSTGIGSPSATIAVEELARLGVDNVPIPFSPPLEQEVLPDKDDIVAEIRTLF